MSCHTWQVGTIWMLLTGWGSGTLISCPLFLSPHTPLWKPNICCQSQVYNVYFPTFVLGITDLYRNLHASERSPNQSPFCMSQSRFTWQFKKNRLVEEFIDRALSNFTSISKVALWSIFSCLFCKVAKVIVGWLLSNEL
jgi:hypothetical protein